MPTYVYRREDGSTFEIEQRISEPALVTCPTTGQGVRRVITGAGLIFKGSGFYLTDYVRNGKGSNGKSGEQGKENAKAEGTTSSTDGAEKTAPSESKTTKTDD